jgi:hypothetical protein
VEESGCSITEAAQRTPKQDQGGGNGSECLRLPLEVAALPAKVIYSVVRFTNSMIILGPSLVGHNLRFFL